MVKSLVTTLLLFGLCAEIQKLNAQNLQSITNGTGNNITSNRIVIGAAADDGASNLQVTGGITFNSLLSNTMARPVLVYATSNEFRARSITSYLADDGFLRLSAGGGTNANTKTYIDLSGYSTVPDMVQNMVFGTSGVERIRINSSGNVGIGIANPQSKLAVNGTITAKKVVVTQTGWADFVFADDYQLPSLKATAEYIKTHKHLPEVPSAAIIEKDGQDVGEMNKILLQKVEELTLHLIKQEQQQQKMQQQIDALQRKAKTQK